MNQTNWRKIFSEEDNKYLSEKESEKAREIFNNKGFLAAMNYVQERFAANGLYKDMFKVKEGYELKDAYSITFNVLPENINAVEAWLKKNRSIVQRAYWNKTEVNID